MQRAANFQFIRARRLGCVVVGVLLATGRAFAAVTVAEEVAIGKPVAAKVERQHGGVLPPDHPLSQRLTRLGAQVSALATRRDVHYRYRVLQDQWELNACAVPGGPIYVTQRLMETVANDAELVYIIGHETAHIDRRHIADSIDRRNHLQDVMRQLGSQMFGARPAKKGSRDLELAADVVLATLGRGYAREHETDADLWGVRWMSRLGYDPRSAVSALRLASRQRISMVEGFLSRHPAGPDRQARIKQLIKDENLLATMHENSGPRYWYNAAVAAKQAQVLAASRRAAAVIKPVAVVAPEAPAATTEPPAVIVAPTSPPATSPPADTASAAGATTAPVAPGNANQALPVVIQR